MTTVTKKAPAEKTTQEVCIDLPGEEVRCWRSADNIRVILRKHRDVIFDLNLGNNKSYTVEATESDFYNARDKKLIFAKRRETVAFKDGERLHLWVTRGFKGALLLKLDGKLVTRIEPNKLDEQQYNNDPKTKPAPIIVSIGQTKIAENKTNPASNELIKQATKNELSSIAARMASSAAVDEDCPVVCVVDGQIKGMPEPLVNYFKQGGNSGLADIDPNDVATRNWIWGQVAGATAYVADNWAWLRASLDEKTHKGFRLVKAQVRYVRGKVYFYFSGYSNTNAVFGRGGFGPGHDRIMSIFGGIGKTSSAFAATAKGVASAFKGNALVSFIFGSATAVSEWSDDTKKDGYDLAAMLIAGLVKVIIAAALASIAVAMVLMVFMLIATSAVPVIAVGALTIVAGIGTSYIVDAGDKRLGKIVSSNSNNMDGVATSLAPLMRDARENVSESWNYLVNKFPADYKGLSF